MSINPSSWKDPAIRAVRTFVQAFVGAIVASGILNVLATGDIEASAIQQVLIAAGFAGLSAVVSLLQNALEDSGTIGTAVK